MMIKFVSQLIEPKMITLISGEMKCLQERERLRRRERKRQRERERERERGGEMECNTM